MKGTNKNNTRLIIQSLGILFIVFGIWSFVSSIFMKWDLPLRSPILVNLFFGVTGIIFIIAGYRLIRLLAKGRELAALLIGLNFISLLGTSRASFTFADSVFSYRFWAFQYQFISNNSNYSNSMFTLLILGLIGLHVVFLLILSSKSAIELFNNQDSAL